MSREPDDRLLEAALEVTDSGAVDWDQVRAALPGEPRAVEALAAIARLQMLADAPDEDPLGSSVTATEAGPDDMAAPSPARERWGPLSLRRRLGAGSFGEVWLAYDSKLQRDVALKLHHARTDRSSRWLEEARRLARVRHPGVVTVYGVEVHDGLAGMWMELIRGQTLEERLRRDGSCSAREAALIGIELCGALAAVHAAGLAHGDLKTRNVMREGSAEGSGEAGRIVLMDFGSAHDSAVDTTHAPGTPLATAPEVLAGERCTAASDLWSLGVLLFRIVSGRWPVEARSLEELRERIAREGPTSLRSLRPGLPNAFVATVERLLARDPSQRPRDTVEVERELLGMLGADPSSANAEQHRRRVARLRRGLGVAAALVALAGIAWAARAYGPRAWMAWRTRTLPLTSRLVATQAGESASAFHGSVVRAVGDLDGDTHSDVVVSAPGENEGGRVHLLTPSRAGLVPVLSISAERIGDGFGAAVDLPGDLNADGHDDLVVSAFFHDGPAGRDAGRVYVYFGGAPFDTTADVIFDGAHPTQYCGWGLGGGDVNGDGHDDLLIGAPYDNTVGGQAGRVYVLFGGPGFDATPDLVLAPDTGGGGYGQTIGWLGDWNGDGAGDFVVGAPTHAGGGQRRGRAFVYFGGALLDDRADVVIDGTQDQAMFGIVRTPSADVNGDGWPDLLLGAERGPGLEPMSGSVSVYFGGPRADAVADLVLRGERRGDGFGQFLSSMGDIDGDGVTDLLVGAPWYDEPGRERAGRAYVFLGGPHMDDVPDAVVRGTAAEATLGWGGCVLTSEAAGAPNRLLLGLRGALRPYIYQGAVELHDLAFWEVLTPMTDNGWRAGREATLRWRGPRHADVALSLDGGRTWRVVARRAGGRAVNALSVPVPGDAARVLQVRLTLAGQERGAVTREIALGR